MNGASLYRCLGEPTRLALVEHLAETGPAPVSALVEATGEEQSNVSHHLAELRACGLVVSERDGKRNLYQLAHPRLAELLDLGAWLADHVDCTEPEACLEAGCCT
jgi:ArsR family transcriptional regulator